MTSKPLRILVSGDVNGRFDQLFSRITSIQQKSGSFDLLLCVGNFFGDKTEEWHKYSSGSVKVPLPVLILGPNKGEHVHWYKDMQGGDLCENVTYLGKKGLYNGSSGLQLAYLSGTQSDFISDNTSFNALDINSLTDPVKNDSKFKGVDILITSQWPEGVEKYSTELYLYAFSMMPMSQMDAAELVSQPLDVTECPYKENSSVSVQAERQDQYFYDVKDDSGGKKRRAEGGADKQQKKHKPVPTGPCWFCLGSPEVEKHLVVSVGSETYLALAKGALVDEHILILPIGHYQSTVTVPEEVLEEIERYKKAIKKYLKKQGKAVVFFERNYKTQHLQIQAVPIPQDSVQDIKDMFFECAESESIELNEIPVHSDIRQIVQIGVPYFYAEVPTGEKLYCRISGSPKFPLQFGREVLASHGVLNMPERADWKVCSMSKTQEASLAAEFKSKFKKYDFTLED
ncbi:CWF19-like protein 1 isoform X3 [Mercenaria mercenaria]|uniref:CWF19-like protein 1 isoform X3 n=1 Tax=Mercenaria mercenaria TaxID=6596 RepID=UPI00234F7A0C|nr:CWF19-like protein 1 isoform X3 [Mercenaria mercenaria]